MKKQFFFILLFLLSINFAFASIEIGNIEMGDTSLEDIKDEEICRVQAVESKKKYIKRYKCENFPFLGKKDFVVYFYIIDEEIHKMEIMISDKQLFNVKLFLEKTYRKEIRRSEPHTFIDFSKEKPNTLAFSLYENNMLRLVYRVSEDEEKMISLISTSSSWRKLQMEYYKKSIGLN